MGAISLVWPGQTAVVKGDGRSTRMDGAFVQVASNQCDDVRCVHGDLVVIAWLKGLQVGEALGYPFDEPVPFKARLAVEWGVYSNPPGTILTSNSFSLATVFNVWPSKALTKRMKSRMSNFTFLASLVVAKARGTTAWRFGGSKQVASVAQLNVCVTLCELHQDLAFLASNPEVRCLLEAVEDRKVLKARRRTDALAVQAWESAREGPDDSAGYAGLTSLGQ